MRQRPIGVLVAFAATILLVSVLAGTATADPANVGGYRAIASNAAFSFDVGTSSFSATVFTGSMAPWDKSVRDKWTVADLNVTGPGFSIYECFQFVPNDSYAASMSWSRIHWTMSCTEGVSNQAVDVTVDLALRNTGAAEPHLTAPPDFVNGYLLDTFTRAGGTADGSISFLGGTYPIHDAQASIWTALAHYVQTP